MEPPHYYYTNRKPLMRAFQWYLGGSLGPILEAQRSISPSWTSCSCQLYFLPPTTRKLISSSANPAQRRNDIINWSMVWTLCSYRFSAGQGQLMNILVYFWWAAKTIAGSYMRVTMGKLMVWALKLDPNHNQDTKWKPTSRAFDWCNNNGGVPL